MHDYACYNGSLVYDKTDDVVVYTDEEWEAAIVLPENRLMEPGTETQRQMVYVQEFMGQYNSYLQGANTQIANSSRTLAGLARGQSMYGDSEAGLAVVGPAPGRAIALAVHKVRRKNYSARLRCPLLYIQFSGS